MRKLLLLSISLVVLSAQAQQNTIIVLDASGSMWGQIDGVNKIVIARDVIGGLMENWDDSIQLGLLAYGHRSEGDCNDIELLVPPAPNTATTIADAVNSINPKGKTPLTAAVKQAAEALRYQDAKATVILVSDGKETCNLDPCTISTELEQAGVDFTAHVIGFDVGEAEQAGLACIAENTGGRFLAAADAGELQTALTTAVEEVKQDTPVGLYLTAAQTVGGKQIEDQVKYTVFAPDPDMTGKRKQITAWGIHPTHLFELEPGTYYVTAKHGKASAAAMLEVKPDAVTEHEFVLGSGKLELAADYAEGGPPVDSKVSYTVYEATPGIDGKREQVAAWGIHPTHTFTLASGTYYVEAKAGEARVNAELTVAAEDYVKHRFNLNAGNLDLYARLGPDSDEMTTKVDYKIFSNTTNMQGKREQLAAWSIHPSRLFTLPAGEYPVRAKWGTAVVEETISVPAGQYKKHVFTLNGALLDLSATIEGTPTDSKVSYEIYEPEPGMDGKHKRITAWSIHATHQFQLAAGRYLVKAKQGDLTAATTIELTPGEFKNLSLALQAKE